MITMGVDPGCSGALAFVNHEDGIIYLDDMPTVSIKRNGKMKKELDYIQLGVLLSRFRWDNMRAYVEQVGAMQKQGVSSTWNFGKATGAVYGALGALSIETKSVSPMKWKKYFGLTGKDKDASRLLAIERWPHLEPKLKLKKWNGRSDALLIAQYGIEVGN